MAHMIEIVNGKVSAAIRDGKPAWHSLGNPLTGKETPEQARVIAGMNWGTTVSPLVLNGYDTGKKVIYRESDGRPLGFVSDGYGEVDHRVHIDSTLGPLVPDYAEWDCLASLNNGSRYFATVKLGGMRLAGDDYNMYVCVSGSYDGTLIARSTPTLQRVVCANTVQAMLARGEGGFAIRHRGKAQAKVIEAGELIAQSIKAFEGTEEKLEQLRANKIDSVQFRNIVQAVYRVKQVKSKELSPLLSDILDETSGTALTREILAETEASTRARLVPLLEEVYESAPGAVPGTMYGALQAVTYYDTHLRGRSEEARVQATLVGENRIAQLLQYVQVSAS
jgi:phage/plasmid-like protein (TIGR03299 family)